MNEDLAEIFRVVVFSLLVGAISYGVLSIRKALAGKRDLPSSTGRRTTHFAAMFLKAMSFLYIPFVAYAFFAGRFYYGIFFLTMMSAAFFYAQRLRSRPIEDGNNAGPTGDNAPQNHAHG